MDILFFTVGYIISLWCTAHAIQVLFYVSYFIRLQFEFPLIIWLCIPTIWVSSHNLTLYASGLIFLSWKSFCMPTIWVSSHNLALYRSDLSFLSWKSFCIPPIWLLNDNIAFCLVITTWDEDNDLIWKLLLCSEIIYAFV